METKAQINSAKKSKVNKKSDLVEVKTREEEVRKAALMLQLACW